MAESVKGFITKDGEAQYDFHSLEDIPEAIKSIYNTSATVGQHFAVTKVDSEGKVVEVKPVSAVVELTATLDDGSTVTYQLFGGVK